MDKRQFIKTLFCGAGIACLYKPLSAISESGIVIPPEVGKKWTREAQFYTVTPKGIRCLLCPNECNIKEGDLGNCRARLNKNGKLYSISYGNPCAVHIDPIEKKPLFHFYPGTNAFSIATAGCNLACLYCQNWSISQKSPRDTQNTDLLPDRLISYCKQNGCKSIAYTYSEPVTFYEYVYDSATLARQEEIKNVFISSGFINSAPLAKLCKVIDSANIDLKSFSDDIYMRLCAGKLQPILNSLTLLKKEGIWLEITNLVVPSWTDNMDMIKRMCNWLLQNGFETTPLHFSRFIPTYKLSQLPPTPVNTLKSAREIALKEGLKYVYIGNVPGLEMENTLCPRCHAIIIERQGFRVVQNYVVGGKCVFCGEKIDGVW